MIAQILAVGAIVASSLTGSSSLTPEVRPVERFDLQVDFDYYLDRGAAQVESELTAALPLAELRARGSGFWTVSSAGHARVMAEGLPFVARVRDEGSVTPTDVPATGGDGSVYVRVDRQRWERLGWERVEIDLETALFGALKRRVDVKTVGWEMYRIDPEPPLRWVDVRDVLRDMSYVETFEAGHQVVATTSGDDFQTVEATLGDGVAGISATRAFSEFGAIGAGEVIAVFDVGFDIAAIEAASSVGMVGLGANFSGQAPSHSGLFDCGNLGSPHGSEVGRRAAATAPAATIVPVKVKGPGGCGVVMRVEAMTWAAGQVVAGLTTNPNPARIFNWSFGDINRPDYCPLSSYASAHGVLVVASAGNDFLPIAGQFHPGACAGVLMVGNTDGSGGREGSTGRGSNTGARVDVSAPAGNTSFATPYAAGIAALVWSKNPLLGPEQVRQVVRSTTQPLAVPCSDGCGTGIANVYGAVRAVIAGDILPVPPVLPAAGSAVGFGFRPLVPARLIDTRLAGQGPRLAAGQTFVLQVRGRGGVPSSPLVPAQAAVLNVTSTDNVQAGYLTVFPCSATRPATSTVNFNAGQTAAASVTVHLAPDGTVCVFTLVDTDLVVDVSGYFDGHPDSFGYTADQATPRLVDSRSDGSRLRVGAAPVEVVVPGGVAGEAVTLNMTATDTAGPGYVTAFPCGIATPVVSNVNYNGVLETVPNQATVAVGAGGRICLVAGVNDTDIVVDLQGRWRAGPGARFVPIAPARVVDTRIALGVANGHKQSPGAALQYVITVRANVRALVGTVTIVGPNREGYVQIAPCDPALIAANRSSALNFVTADVARSNAVYSPIEPGNNATCISVGPAPNTPLVHIVLDITGWYV